ncbi:MAG: TA system VapC family ribonuclease toxin [Myxococcales bacterium]
MLAPDVNILVYAHRQDERVHPSYARWLTELVNGRQPFALSVLCAVAFVRIVTNAKLYAAPSPLSAALAAIDQLATHPNCRWVAPAADHWQRVAALCRATRATAKLVADAQHAAVAMAEGCTWVTRDSDFGQFARHGLDWQHLVL